MTITEKPIRPSAPASRADLLDRLVRQAGYLADAGLAAAAFLSDRLERPLFLEGEPGVGKTSFAAAMAAVLGSRLVRLQCHGGIDAAQALYDWNFPQQVLTLRALGDGDHTDRVPSLWTRDFLVARPILDAIENGPAVLLVDEIDRADDEFEALLLQVLENYEIDIPDLDEKKIKAEHRPFVILTSNRTRDVHDAIRRRCLYHWISHPDEKREVDILLRRIVGLGEPLAMQVAAAMARLRQIPGLYKCPGVAESIDLARALHKLGCTELTGDEVEAALGTVAKHHDDVAVIRDVLLPKQRDHR